MTATVFNGAIRLDHSDQAQWVDAERLADTPLRENDAVIFVNYV
jgi:hypothetical protein